jgi:hypothetical protein
MDTLSHSIRHLLWLMELTTYRTTVAWEMLVLALSSHDYHAKYFNCDTSRECDCHVIKCFVDPKMIVVMTIKSLNCQIDHVTEICESRMAFTKSNSDHRLL